MPPTLCWASPRSLPWDLPVNCSVQPSSYCLSPQHSTDHFSLPSLLPSLLHPNPSILYLSDFSPGLGLFPWKIVLMSLACQMISSVILLFC